VFVVTKSLLTYTNCGKLGHTLETYHNWKKKLPILPTAIVKSTKPIVEIETEVAKLIGIPICYPYTIYFSVEQRFGECPRKIELQNMFRTKFVSFNITIALKPPKLDNVLVNVVGFRVNN
jgi:hypothetical protein